MAHRQNILCEVLQSLVCVFLIPLQVHSFVLNILIVLDSLWTPVHIHKKILFKDWIFIFLENIINSTNKQKGCTDRLMERKKKYINLFIRTV